MTPTSWIAIASVVAALTFVVLAIFLVRTLVQVRRTAEEVESTVRRVQPLITELEATVRDVRGLSGRIGDTVGRVDRVVGSLETLGSHAVRASSVVLTGVAGPVGRAAAIWNAVRTGAGLFRKILGRNHKESPRGRRGVTPPEAPPREYADRERGGTP